MVNKPPSSKEVIAQGAHPRTLIHDDDAATVADEMKPLVEVKYE
jgi:hypothetical protein